VGNPDNLFATLNAEEEADFIKKRITVNGLQTLGNAIADSRDQPQPYLSDPRLYANIVQQANLAEYRASNIRPGPAGIEFSNAFIEVCLHANANQVLRLPLITEFNVEAHAFKGDAEMKFWEEMKAEFKKEGLHEEADEVCEGRVSEKWIMRNKKFWTEVWSRRGDINVKMFVPCRQQGDSRSAIRKRPSQTRTRTEGTSDQVLAVCYTSEISPYYCHSDCNVFFLQRTTHAGTASWNERLRSSKKPKWNQLKPQGLPNLGNSCYQNCILQVGSKYSFLI
jgi:hypothetical protein